MTDGAQGATKRLTAAKCKSSYFTLPFSQTRLADYICVDRSAMVRELKHMTEEGLIEIERRNVKLKKAAP